MLQEFQKCAIGENVSLVPFILNILIQTAVLKTLLLKEKYRCTVIVFIYLIHVEKLNIINTNFKTEIAEFVPRTQTP